MTDERASIIYWTNFTLPRFGFTPWRCRSKVYQKKYDRLDDIKDIRNFIRVALNSINSSVEEFLGTLFNCGDIWHWKNDGIALFGSFLYSRDEQTRWTWKRLSEKHLNAISFTNKTSGTTFTMVFRPQRICRERSSADKSVRLLLIGS